MAPSGAADGCGAADDSVGVGVERRGGSHGRGAVDDGGALEWSHRRRRRRQLRPYSSLSGAGVASPASFPAGRWNGATDFATRHVYAL